MKFICNGGRAAGPLLQRRRIDGVVATALWAVRYVRRLCFDKPSGSDGRAAGPWLQPRFISTQRPSFDFVAPWYRAIESLTFGQALQQARIACLNQMRAPARVLIVGEGNGRFLVELLRRFPESKVDCVDASARMLQLVAKRLGDKSNANVLLLNEDITKWQPPADHYDLVVTHFVLDCFDESIVDAVVSTLARASSQGAEWLLADFRLPERGLARLNARAWLALMYRFFRLTARIEAKELVDPTPSLQRQGFTRVRQSLFWNGMLKSELWRRTL